MTERDRWILETVGKLRFCTTGQLARLYFGRSGWAANKRLRKLLDGGLVRVWLRTLSEENVYSLTSAGARALGEPNGDGTNWPAPRGLDGNLDHLLAINQVRISLALDLPGVGGELAWWRSDWELPRSGRAPVVPDALFAVRWEDSGEQVFALELDNRKRSPQAFLKKVLRYGQARRRGLGFLSDALMLAVGRDQRWVERYRLTLRDARVGSRVWFATLASIQENGSTGPVWMTAGDEAGHSLRDLASLPYGKEGSTLEKAKA